MRRTARFFRFRALIALAPFVLALPVARGVQAQQVQGAPIPAGMSEADVLDRLRQSGMSRAQARARLSEMGYDPSLADPYYDRLEGRSSQPLPVDTSFVRALETMGMASVGRLPTARVDTVATAVAPPLPDTFKIFGRSVFSGPSTQFQPDLQGPVDPAYQLGPGDQLALVLTGNVELAYTLEVTREGFVVIPDVGQVFVNGLTLEGLRNQLYGQLGRVYSGVRRNGGTTFFDISLGRIRTNQVFVIGDVVRPGAYQVSAVSTVFNALQLAGGPSNMGTFRRVVVRRGGTVLRDVDLYDYLLRGDASGDVRLNHGDIVFVAPAGPQVFVQGKVRRPAIYEMKEGEGIRDVLTYAGGFEPDAALQRVQIDRVLGPGERLPGVDRVLLDVNIAELADPTGENVPLKGGDEVHVFATLTERRNRVNLLGSVFRPGLYEYRPGMTVWDLIRRADGLSEEAFTPLAHVIRPILETGGRELLQVSLAMDESGRPVADLALEDRDSVVVYAADSLATRQFVQVQGYVKHPGRYLFAAGSTVRDMILAAGGFQEGAEVYEADVARLRIGRDRSDSLAIRFTVALDGDLPAEWAPAVGGPRPGLTRAGDFKLEEGDRVFVRRMPGFEPGQTVVIAGEVLRPGPYAVESRSERLSSVIAKAGGATKEAFMRGGRLVRRSVPVGVDIEAALRRPGGREDVVLEDGDVITIPRLDPTVLVRGAVAFEARVVYRQGAGVADYLRQAGGTTQLADEGRVSVEYPNGERATAKKALFFKNYPEVLPGSTITVPAAAPKPPVNWDEFLTRTLSITASIVTVLLAASKL